MATSKARKSSGKSGTGSKSRAAAARPVGGALPPYGPPIRDAMARGDVAEMKRVAASARKWLKDVQGALDKLDQRVAKLSAK